MTESQPDVFRILDILRIRKQIGFSIDFTDEAELLIKRMANPLLKEYRDSVELDFKNQYPKWEKTFKQMRETGEELPIPSRTTVDYIIHTESQYFGIRGFSLAHRESKSNEIKAAAAVLLDIHYGALSVMYPFLIGHMEVDEAQEAVSRLTNSPEVKAWLMEERGRFRLQLRREPNGYSLIDSLVDKVVSDEASLLVREFTAEGAKVASEVYKLYYPGFERLVNL